MSDLHHENLHPHRRTLHLGRRLRRLKSDSLSGLSGAAAFDVGEETVPVAATESLPVPPQTPHRIANYGAGELRFLVIPAPKAPGARVNL